MKSIRTTMLSILQAVALVFIGSVLLAGCASDNVPRLAPEEVKHIGVPSESKLRIGDQLTVRFDTMGGVTPPPMHETILDEKGEISLTLVGRVKAEGKTSSQLATEIQSLYVPRYYVHCNVTVLTAERSFYMGGEVKTTGKFAWSEDITLLKAINMAGSFTEYSNRGSVELTRGQKKMLINTEEARRDPAKDIKILPGDSIWVPRSIW